MTLEQNQGNTQLNKIGITSKGCSRKASARSLHERSSAKKLLPLMRGARSNSKLLDRSRRRPLSRLINLRDSPAGPTLRAGAGGGAVSGAFWARDNRLSWPREGPAATYVARLDIILYYKKANVYKQETVCISLGVQLIGSLQEFLREAGPGGGHVILRRTQLIREFNYCHRPRRGAAPSREIGFSPRNRLSLAFSG
ncbi:hypothetical protein EVAR_91430_1 [Eumeta japonica]|uniref:Uncharacterized protein n=1 Tax=Eumeta variegata TaxID=151549 RepID=A0A4C1WZ80_EUMVA|nr:hypothetical protein EVAR_91430_1 [Eumeta japonica]